MTGVHIALGSITIALTAAAGLWGAWCWRQKRSDRGFWWLLRASQVFVVIEAIDGGIWILAGHKATQLHLLYGLLPIGVGFMAEQLRLSAAQMVLDQRGFASAKEVGRLPADEQAAIVVSVLRREIGVMTLAALVCVVLLARAASVH